MGAFGEKIWRISVTRSLVKLSPVFLSAFRGLVIADTLGVVRMGSYTPHMPLAAAGAQPSVIGRGSDDRHVAAKEL